MSASTAFTDSLISSLASGSIPPGLCILDSCGVGRRRRNRLFAAIEPAEQFKVSSRDPLDTLAVLDEISRSGRPAVFTLSYDFGLKLNSISSRHSDRSVEPDLFCAVYDSAIVFDYESGKVSSYGTPRDLLSKVSFPGRKVKTEAKAPPEPIRLSSVPERDEYISKIEVIKEHIRDGETYQANLTRKISVQFNEPFSPLEIFVYGRQHHPAAFAAYIDRGDSRVISLSPECFFSVRGRDIVASPIKGTRRRKPRFTDDASDVSELTSSEKDRAENIMIVDLLRNDLGRICEFGSICANRLLEVEELPTLFHLVSHITGKLRKSIGLCEIISALFPCGSITGAPKIRTMKILDSIEPTRRGLSMGAIGLILPSIEARQPDLDVSVAIRTIVCRGSLGEFNVGGGIVIDSNPAAEFDETVTKATALLAACGVRTPSAEIFAAG